MTRKRMLRFTRRYQDTVQERLAILISFHYKFIGVHMCQNYQNRQSYCKNKMVQFFTHSVYILIH